MPDLPRFRIELTKTLALACPIVAGQVGQMLMGLVDTLMVGHVGTSSLAAAVWKELGWRFPERLDRVYVNTAARDALGWRPRFDLNAIAARLAGGESVHTPLSRKVGSKEYANSLYHAGVFQPTGSDLRVPSWAS